MVVYLDDIVLHGNDSKLVWQETVKVIRRLTDAGFMINLSKSHFLVKSAVILGYEVSHGVIKPNPKKITSFVSLKPPKMFKEL